MYVIDITYILNIWDKIRKTDHHDKENKSELDEGKVFGSNEHPNYKSSVLLPSSHF